MKVSVKKNKDCKVQMSIELEAAAVESRYQEVLRDFQRQANLPGFREGRAPADLVEKRYADQAREELLKSLIPEVYHQSVRSQKVQPVSLPKISGVQYVRGQKLTFSAEFEEAPSVNVKNYKGLKLKRVTAEVSAEELEKAMQHLRESRAGQKETPPELNDEFAKSMGLETLESLREAVKKELSVYKRAESHEKMKIELFEKLLVMAAFPVPESLVDKQTERLIADTRQHYARLGMSEGQWKQEEEKVRSEAAARSKDQIKIYFILQRIAELEEIEADEIELAARIEALAKQSGRPAEEVRQMFEDDLRDSFREKKTVDFLIANAKFEEERSAS